MIHSIVGPFLWALKVVCSVFRNPQSTKYTQANELIRIELARDSDVSKLTQINVHRLYLNKIERGGEVSNAMSISCC